MSPALRDRWLRAGFLNAGVPLLLLVVYAVCFGLYTLRREARIGVEHAETFTLRKVTLEMTQLQGSFDAFLRDGKLGAVREQLAGLSSNPYLQVGLLIDDQQKVLASTRLALLGREVREAWPELARPEHAERMAEARQHMNGIVEVSSDGQRVVGYYPVFLSFGKPPRSIGFLYFQHDLTAAKAASLHEVEQSVLRSSVMLVLIAGAMGLFVQFTLGRRIQRLVLAAQEVLGRRQDTPSQDSRGEDALGELGQAVHQMAEQIGHSRRQIAQTEERFQKLIDRSPDAIFIHREGTLVFHNPGAAVMLGYAREESLKGRPLAELVVSEDVLALGEGLEEGAPRELQWVHRTGRLVLGEGVTFRLEFEGAPARVLIVRDITERKQLQEQLNAADRMASLGTLAAGVAHEINNPLSFMLSNARFIQDELRELTAGWEGPARERMKEVHAALEELLAGGDRVSEIVLDLKKFSRRDEGRRGEVDLHAVLDLCGNIAKSQLRHRARLVKDYGELPLVLGSESRLGQLFLNLIINAAQAIPEDGDAERHEVRITTRREAEGWVVVAVQDTGVGIPREHLGRLFEPFFTTKPVGVGTGLGLSICHGIVTGLGGRITVDSEPGRGSTFRVFLPIGGVELSAPDAEAP